MRGHSYGYKRDISDGSNPDWCIYRKKRDYVVAKVQARMDDDAVIPFVEPAHTFSKRSEAVSCYSQKGAA